MQNVNALFIFGVLDFNNTCAYQENVRYLTSLTHKNGINNKSKNEKNKNKQQHKQTYKIKNKITK